NYLPEGLSLPEDVSSTVVFDVRILPYNSVSLTYNTRDIRAVGLPSNYISAFDVSQIELKISGPEEALSTLSKEDIKAVVDLKSALVGTREYPVDVTLPEGLELVETPKVSVTVSRMKSTDSGKSEKDL
ncbi:MAG: CdaR family protein, partial [bacterium]